MNDNETKLREALDGIFWMAGSTPDQSVLRSIAARAKEALRATEPKHAAEVLAEEYTGVRYVANERSRLVAEAAFLVGYKAGMLAAVPLCEHGINNNCYACERIQAEAAKVPVS